MRIKRTSIHKPVSKPPHLFSHSEPPIANSVYVKSSHSFFMFTHHTSHTYHSTPRLQKKWQRFCADARDVVPMRAPVKGHHSEPRHTACPIQSPPKTINTPLTEFSLLLLLSVMGQMSKPAGREGKHSFRCAAPKTEFQIEWALSNVWWLCLWPRWPCCRCCDVTDYDVIGRPRESVYGRPPKYS